MATRNIVQVGDDVLRKKSFPVSEINDKIIELLNDMKETLKKAEGVGLAAPQVGVLKRIFIISLDGQYYECINPEIISKSGSQKGEEGCLSVRGKYGTVVRPMKVVVRATDRFGKEFTVNAQGFLARAFCHEYDHLDGILYIDKAENISEVKG